MKHKISLIYKILILIVCTISIYLNFEAFTVQGAVIYYTVQSNIICFLFYLVTIILYFTKKLKKNNLYYIFKGFVTIAITITFFVYWIALSSNMSGYEGHELSCIFAHLIVPLSIMLDYAIFGEKGNLKSNYPFIWSTSLLLYLLFNIIYVLLGGTFYGGSIYPYPYMNVEEYGLIGVSVNCLMIYIFVIGYGTIIQQIDNKLGKNKKQEVFKYGRTT